MEISQKQRRDRCTRGVGQKKTTCGVASRISAWAAHPTSVGMLVFHCSWLAFGVAISRYMFVETNGLNLLLQRRRSSPFEYTFLNLQGFQVQTPLQIFTPLTHQGKLGFSKSKCTYVFPRHCYCVSPFQATTTLISPKHAQLENNNTLNGRLVWCVWAAHVPGAIWPNQGFRSSHFFR